MAFKEYKGIKDNSKKIIYENQNDEVNYIKNLKPILLDNGNPLVNEENKPFLGINNMFFIDENENPIVGSRELYKNNKVVKGELGIIPKNNKGNLIKINNKNENNKNIGKNLFNDVRQIKKIGEKYKENKKDENQIKKLENKLGSKMYNNENNIAINNFYPKIIKTRINLHKIPLNKNIYRNQRKKLNSSFKNNKYNKEMLLSSCFACDVGCGVSRTGYSPMTYSPFNNKIIRKEETGLKNGVKYKQYYRYKKLQIKMQ